MTAAGTRTSYATAPPLICGKNLASKPPGSSWAATEIYAEKDKQEAIAAIMKVG